MLKLILLITAVAVVFALIIVSADSIVKMVTDIREDETEEEMKI